MSSWSTLPAVRVVNDVVMTLFAVVAAACAFAAAVRLSGRRRTAWLWIAAGLCGFAAGQLIWTYNGITSPSPPSHSVADIGYAFLSIGTGMALLVMLRDYPRSTMLRVLLDGVIVAGALFGAAWAALLATVYTAKMMNWVALGLSLMYPVASIAVVTIALLLLVRATPVERGPLAMLTTGLALILISDVAFAYVTAVRGVFDEAISLGYAYGFVAIGTAALMTRARSAIRPCRRPHHGWSRRTRLRSRSRRRHRSRRPRRRRRRRLCRGCRSRRHPARRCRRGDHPDRRYRRCRTSPWTCRRHRRGPAGRHRRRHLRW
nr:hypothetical protein [Mycolicibacterium poriferae]